MLIPNLGGSGVVLLLNGIDRLAAAAAGEFVISGAFSELLNQKKNVPYAEVLLRVRGAAGAPAHSEVVRSAS